LKNVNFDIDFLQEDKLLAKTNTGVIEKKIEPNTVIVDYSFENVSIKPNVVGNPEVNLSLKFYLKEEDKVIGESKIYPFNYYIKGTYWEKRYRDFDVLNYNSGPQRRSDEGLDFLIPRRLEKSFTYLVINREKSWIMRDLVMDLHCTEPTNENYFVDYPDYLNKYYANATQHYDPLQKEFKKDRAITGELPIVIQPCNQRTMILRERRNSMIYVRAF